MQGQACQHGREARYVGGGEFQNKRLQLESVQPSQQRQLRLDLRWAGARRSGVKRGFPSKYGCSATRATGSMLSGAVNNSGIHPQTNKPLA